MEGSGVLLRVDHPRKGRGKGLATMEGSRVGVRVGPLSETSSLLDKALCET